MVIAAIARLKQSLQGPLVSSAYASHAESHVRAKHSPIVALRANAAVGAVERQDDAATAEGVIPPDVMLHARLGLRRRY